MTSRSPAACPALRSALPVLLAAVLGLLSGCSGRHGTTPAAAPPASSASRPSQPAHPANPELTAEIGFSHAQSVFRIENRDTFPWSNCQFILNAHGPTSRYGLAMASVQPGVKETVELRAGDFTAAAGKKFDPAVDRVATLDFDCDTPQGRLRSEQFLLGEPPGHGKPQ